MADLYDRSRPSYPQTEFERWRPRGRRFRLAPPHRERLLTEIAAAIDGRGGSFRVTFVTLLCLARAA